MAARSGLRLGPKITYRVSQQEQAPPALGFCLLPCIVICCTAANSYFYEGILSSLQRNVMQPSGLSCWILDAYSKLCKHGKILATHAMMPRKAGANPSVGLCTHACTQVATSQITPLAALSTHASHQAVHLACLLASLLMTTCFISCLLPRPIFSQPPLTVLTLTQNVPPCSYQFYACFSHAMPVPLLILICSLLIPSNEANLLQPRGDAGDDGIQQPGLLSRSWCGLFSWRWGRLICCCSCPPARNGGVGSSRACDIQRKGKEKLHRQ